MLIALKLWFALIGGLTVLAILVGTITELVHKSQKAHARLQNDLEMIAKVQNGRIVRKTNSGQLAA